MTWRLELEPRLVKDIKDLGVKGYTLGKVNGHGVHGRRSAGIADASSSRFEMLVSPAIAQAILQRIAESYRDQPVIAYLHEVEAIPADRFR
ncbi:MAG TPA: hypothetical protein VEK07_15445 [Polyangiaceae bacterium]|nr:hypothetical protein [Polyangiaceae bacterium]